MWVGATSFAARVLHDDDLWLASIEFITIAVYNVIEVRDACSYKLLIIVFLSACSVCAGWKSYSHQLAFSCVISALHIVVTRRVLCIC